MKKFNNPLLDFISPPTYFIGVKAKHLSRRRIAILTATALLLFLRFCPAGITPFRSEHYSVEQGLSQTSVWTMLQDRRGFLWIGTADGLNKFDGYSFQTFRHNPTDSSSLSNNTVWGLCQDNNDALWIGTLAGVHRLDPLTQKFTRLANDPQYKGTYLEELSHTMLEDHEGLLWFGTTKGVGVLDPVSGIWKQFSSIDLPIISPTPVFRVLHEDNNGDIWIANGERLFRYERTSGKFLQIPVGAKDEKVSFLRSTIDHEGVFWFASHLHGVWSFDPRTGIWNSYRHNAADPYSLADDRLRIVCEDKEGRIWAGTIFEGLCWLDRASGKFHPFKPSSGVNEHGLSSKDARFQSVTFLLQDRSGLLWVGYDGAGMVKVNPYQNKFHHVLLPPSDLMATGDNFFKSLIVDHAGDVWLGMYDQGLSVLNRITGSVKRYRSNPSDPNGLRSNTVFSLLEDTTGNIWIGTDVGLDEFDRRTNRFKHHDMPITEQRGRRIACLSKDSLGTVWCGTATHLLKYDRQHERFEEVLSTPRVFDLQITPAVTAITPSNNGTLWVGTLGGGVLHLQTDGTIIQELKHNADDQNSLSNDNVKTILVAPDGILWIGTEEGLNRYDATHNRWKVYRTSDGLPNEFIYGILLDGRGRLWISTNKGISRMETIGPDQPRFRNYTPDDGLQSYEFNTNVYFQTPEGEMFFGGVNGFNTFFPDSVTDNPHTPPVVFTGFKKIDLPFDPGTDINSLKEIRLAPGETVFSFEFAALEFTNQNQNRYAYKMEGFDKDWIYCGTRREARYTNLDHGEYVFRVKASNSDGVWNEAGTFIKVVIVPPFWKTGWFSACLAVLGIAGFGGSIRYISTRKLRKKIEQLEREKAIQDERLKTRERIARDLHDDLASTVGSAGFFIESVKQQVPDASQQAKDFLNKTSSLLTEAEEAMSDIVWSVSPRHDTLESLIARIRIMTSDICKANHIKYEVNITGDISQHSIADDVRRNIYLIFKEAIANSARHAQAASITVNVNVSSTSFDLEVKDDGRGLPHEDNLPAPSMPTKRGHGLRNMKKRAEEIQAELTIDSLSGKGTTVRLSKRMTQTGH